MIETIAVLATLLAIGFASRWWFLQRHSSLGSPEDRATYTTLHTAAQAAPALRGGLTAESATTALPHIRRLIGTHDVQITDTRGPLTNSQQSRDEVLDLMREAIATGRLQASERIIAAPLAVDGLVVGSIIVESDETSGALTRTTEEVASWMSSQLELAELSASRTALMEAELRALRAQISPHFIYNSLGAIASFVRTDPERARELLLEFADFTRYSFRQHGEFTTLSEELKSIERYLVLEKARFGDRLKVVIRVAPEVLNVTLPFLSVQPLVENAVRHGIEGKTGTGHVTIIADDAGTECQITIEDDGVGSDPEVVADALAGVRSTPSVGLANVDERLRTVYGDDRGLIVETGPGLGTKVTLTIPKFLPPNVTEKR